MTRDDDRRRVPLGPELEGSLARAVDEQRCLFFAGLSGVGKSLLVQQAAIRARDHGRRVHVLQWDATRSAFETPAWLDRFPEVDGVTHPAIRRGVGIWARRGVATWHRQHPDRADLLIGETPLIGNRLVELVHPMADDAEPLLAGPHTRFLVPTPTNAARREIERARAAEIAAPRHARELANAQPALVSDHWRELRAVARRLRIDADDAPSGYDDQVYGEVYLRVLRHRRAQVLRIEQILDVGGSPQDLGEVAGELRAGADDVERIMTTLAQRPTDELAAEVSAWWSIAEEAP